VLSLPLGGQQRERGRPIFAANEAIRAFLRAPSPEPAESAPEPPKTETVASAEQQRAQPESVREPLPAPRESKPARAAKSENREAPSAADREGSAVRSAAIPATFFDPAQLTEIPKPLQDPPMHLLLPLLSRPGVAYLVLSIDELGRVASVDVDSATLPQASVQRAVVLFSGLQFSPGRIDGVAVKSRVRITVGAEEKPKQN
jgi:hypothetical protein